MAFSPCTNQDDPFTRRVREAYSANVVAAPRAGIDPLDTLAVRRRRVEPRGRLEAMLDDLHVTFPEVQTAPAANLTGVRSASVDFELGLTLSAKFLAALGVPIPGADVTASLWQGASGFTFEVNDVSENQVDVAYLGRAIQGRRIERTPATGVFFSGDGTSLYLITRTLTSLSFAIRGTSSKGQSVKVAVDAVKDLLGEASTDVSWKAESEDSLAFSGKVPVTFAFAAVPCAIDAQGAIVFGLTSSDLTFGDQRAADATPVPLIDEAGLVDFDEPRTA
jgi:hypothetical protein